MRVIWPINSADHLTKKQREHMFTTKSQETGYHAVSNYVERQILLWILESLVRLTLIAFVGFSETVSVAETS